MSKLNCPFCDHEHDYHDYDLFESNEHEHFECNSCDRLFNISIEYDPVCYTSVPEDAPLEKDQKVRKQTHNDLENYWLNNS